MALARAHALRAITLDASLAEAHVVLGQVAFQTDWDWSGAERAYRQAIAFAPSYDVAFQGYAYFLAARNQVDRAIEQLERPGN